MERGSPARSKSHGGPTAERDIREPELSEEQLREAISFLRQTPDEDTVRLKMRQTFSARQKMVRDPEKSPHVLATFPRFADVKGLVSMILTLKIMFYLHLVLHGF